MNLSVLLAVVGLACWAVALGLLTAWLWPWSAFAFLLLFAVVGLWAEWERRRHR